MSDKVIHCCWHFENWIYEYLHWSAVICPSSSDIWTSCFIRFIMPTGKNWYNSFPLNASLKSKNSRNVFQSRARWRATLPHFTTSESFSSNPELLFPWQQQQQQEEDSVCREISLMSLTWLKRTLKDECVLVRKISIWHESQAIYSTAMRLIVVFGRWCDALPA